MRRSIFAALIAVLLIVAPVLAAPSGLKFSLTVDHPEGTTLNETEVIYYAELLRGSLQRGHWRLHHICYDAAGAVVSEANKGIWFPSSGHPRIGTAYFFTFGATCTGYVIDAPDDTPVSNVVTYGTSPLP